MGRQILDKIISDVESCYERGKQDITVVSLGQETQGWVSNEPYGCSVATRQRERELQGEIGGCVVLSFV